MEKLNIAEVPAATVDRTPSWFSLNMDVAVRSTPVSKSDIKRRVYRCAIRIRMSWQWRTSGSQLPPHLKDWRSPIQRTCSFTACTTDSNALHFKSTSAENK